MKNRIETLKDREAEFKRQQNIKALIFRGIDWRTPRNSPEDYKKTINDSEKATMSKGK